MTYGKYESEQTIPELCRTNNAEGQTNVTLWRRETRIDCLGLRRRSAARRHHRNRQLFSLRKRHREAEARQRRGTLFCGRRRPSERATAMDGRGRTLNEFLMPCNFARGRQRGGGFVGRQPARRGSLPLVIRPLSCLSTRASYGPLTSQNHVLVTKSPLRPPLLFCRRHLIERRHFPRQRSRFCAHLSLLFVSLIRQ